ncbi:MAG TPA: rhodanese-like domain-containing protein [Acidimicrobiia bacterium]|nr:rhodanese-like domain-containing protein [Acidimicrobiia bacterium]
MTATIDRTTTISTDDLHRRLGDIDLVVVDVRPLAAYNGWTLRGETRGGHLPGAVALPARWLTLVDEIGLDQLLADKGLVDGKTVVIYGDFPGQGADLRHQLEANGAGEVLDYEGGFDLWASRPDLPLERLPNYRHLVYPEWLQRLLDGQTPPTFPGGPFAVFHVNFGVPEEYADGHIPGAFYLDTNWLESEIDWNRRSPEELERALLHLGITASSTVILYGRDSVGNPNEKWPGRRAGQIAATRAAAILRYAGVEDVRLLDGGYDWWVTAGYQLETQTRIPQPANSFGLRIPARPEVMVDLPEAKAILADPQRAALVSVRTWREHTGQTSGYNYIKAKGRIVGDVWGNCGTDAYHMQHYRNVDNTMRPYPEIARNWAEAGITPDKWVAFYCGTGWRASETWFYAYLMGWERIAVYDGGWFEWSQDPLNNPVEAFTAG